MVRGSTFMASPTEGSGAEAFLQLVIAACQVTRRESGNKYSWPEQSDTSDKTQMGLLFCLSSRNNTRFL